MVNHIGTVPGNPFVIEAEGTPKKPISTGKPVKDTKSFNGSGLSYPHGLLYYASPQFPARPIVKDKVSVDMAADATDMGKRLDVKRSNEAHNRTQASSIWNQLTMSRKPENKAPIANRQHAYFGLNGGDTVNLKMSNSSDDRATIDSTGTDNVLNLDIKSPAGSTGGPYSPKVGITNPSNLTINLNGKPLDLSNDSRVHITGGEETLNGPISMNFNVSKNDVNSIYITAADEKTWEGTYQTPTPEGAE
jgi:hypothetical protein